MQPKKKRFNKKYLSQEIDMLFNFISDNMLYEFPTREITPEYFVYTCLCNEECFMGKVIMSLFEGYEEIYDKFYDDVFQTITNKIVQILKPGVEVPVSDLMHKCIRESFVYMNELKSDFITSDHILMSIMDNSKVIRDIMTKYEITSEMIKSESMKLKESLMNNSIDNNTNHIEIQVLGNKDMNINDILPMLTGSNQQQLSEGNESFIINMNEECKKNAYDTLIGRKIEIESIVRVFNRRKSNNVVLVGESGVGKTQIIQGLVKQIVNNECPISFIDHTIYRLDIAKLIAGTSLRGMFEGRINNLISEISKKNNSVLFIDDMHLFISDKHKDDFNLSGLLSDILTNNKIKVILTTTKSGYKDFFEDDRCFERKFQRIDVEPATIEDTILILKGIKDGYEDFHGIVYNDESLISCAKLSERYITDRNLPSSAIDILDEAGAEKHIEMFEPSFIKEKHEKISNLKKAKNKCINENNIDGLNVAKSEIAKQKNEIAQYYVDMDTSKCIVTKEDIAKCVSKHTNIDANHISSSEKKKISDLNERIKKIIKGQDEAIDIVCRSIKRNKVGLYRKDKPILTALCIGSTGVGKTLLAKTLAKELFGDEKNMARINMSEYSDETSVNKLIGSSAGYIGYDKGGVLTEIIKNKKYCVLLIDELEKANDKVYNLFLQIMDDGYLNDNTGEKVDFKNTILILTSNVGAKKAETEKPIGFNVDPDCNKRSIIEKELKNKFSPEFINRIDNIIFFNPLNENTLKEIIVLELDKLNERLVNIGHAIKYNVKVIDYLYNCIKNESNYGARPILRAIQDNVEDLITDILIDTDDSNIVFELDVKKDKLIIK